MGALGPRSPSYQRCAVSRRPSRDITRARPRPSSHETSSTAGSSDRTYPGTSRSSSGAVGNRSPTPRSPGLSRSCHGTQLGASKASGPGSSAVSETVTCLLRETRVTVTAQRQPRYPGSSQSNRWVTTRSPSATTPRCAPTCSVSSASRARSTASAQVWSTRAARAGTAPAVLLVTRTLLPIRRPEAGPAGPSVFAPVGTVAPMVQDGGMSVLRTLSHATAVTARVTRRATVQGMRTGRFMVRHVTVARRRGAAGEAGMMRLLDLHAASCAGDTLVAIGLAGTIFFAVPVGEARGRVALYLLVTMLPFALLAPVVGPVLDRFRHGRRNALSVTMLARAFLAYMISEHIGGFTLYPAAFGILVLSRAYGVARSAAVPRVLPEGLGLSEAGARASVFGALIALRLPPRADSQPPETVPRPLQLPGHKGAKVLSGRLVLATLAGSATLRALYGFLALFLAFTIRSGQLPRTIAGFGLSQEVALGVVAGALAAGSFLATAVGTTLHIKRPAVLQAAVIVLVALAGAAAAVQYTLPFVLVLCLLTALASGLAKLAVDAVIQARVDEDVRASAFAHAETLLMLAWVAGGALGLIPLGGRWGLVLVAGFLLFGAARALISAMRLRRERLSGAPIEEPTKEYAQRRPPSGSDRDRTLRLPDARRPGRRPPSPPTPAPKPEATTKLLPEAPVSPAPDAGETPGYHLYRPSGRGATRRLDEEDE